MRFGLTIWVTLAVSACGGDPAARVDATASPTDGATPGADASTATDAFIGDRDSAVPPAEPRTYPAATFAPSDHGWLHLEPQSVLLRPGETVVLRPTLHDFAGMAATAEVLAWTSSAPFVATVDPSGTVTGVAAGLAEITAEDSGGRLRTVHVAVDDDPPAGAFGIRFSQPLAQIAEGASLEVGWTLVDARGADIAAVDLPSFEAVGAAGVSLVAGPGTLRIEGTSGGTTRVIATLGADEAPLAGTLLVSVARSPLVGPCGADDEDEISCWLEAPPDTFTAPGLSDTLRVVAAERSCGEIVPRIRQVPPDDITLANDDVLTVGGDGTLVSVAPGYASFGVRYRGVACDCPVARVLPDPTGCWTGRCANGDQAMLSLSFWHVRVLHATVPGRVRLGFQTMPATGRARFVNEAAPRYECDGEAAWEPGVAIYGTRHGYCDLDVPPAGGEGIWRPQSWLCSERGCESYDPESCAYTRHVPPGTAVRFSTALRGADAFEFATCAFARTAAAECALPVTPVPPTGTASFRGASMQLASMLRVPIEPDYLRLRYSTPDGSDPDVEVSIALRPMTPGVYRIETSPAAAATCPPGERCAGLDAEYSSAGERDTYDSRPCIGSMTGTAEITEASLDPGGVVAGSFDVQVYRVITVSSCEMLRVTGSFRGTPSTP